MTTDLILKSMNGLGERKSFGGKSLAQNIVDTNASALKVKPLEEIWNRSRSQMTIKYLTCSLADDWMRLRQISAEMADRRSAFDHSKFSYMREMNEVDILRKSLPQTTGLQARRIQIDMAEKEYTCDDMLNKMEGAMKEIQTLGNMYDSLVERMGDINEENFENAEVKGHIKRAVMQGIREMRMHGFIKTGNQEYLDQLGVSVGAARKEILKFLEEERDSGVKDTSLLHKFLDDFADRYADGAKQQADWLGFDANPDVTLTFNNYGV